jgi:hypothetical protein
LKRSLVEGVRGIGGVDLGRAPPGHQRGERFVDERRIGNTQMQASRLVGD